MLFTRIFRFATTALVCMLVSLTSVAQVNPALAEFTNEIEASRTLIQTERKILIMTEIALTAEEAEGFWPLYDEYSNERKKLGNLRVQVITDYAANYETMTDELAGSLLNDSVSYDQKLIKLKKKYIKKFRRVLPNIKVTRYFQLENKLDAYTNFELATQIPLME